MERFGLFLLFFLLRFATINHNKDVPIPPEYTYCGAKDQAMLASLKRARCDCQNNCSSTTLLGVESMYLLRQLYPLFKGCSDAPCRLSKLIGAHVSCGQVAASIARLGGKASAPVPGNKPRRLVCQMCSSWSLSPV